MNSLPFARFFLGAALAVAVNPAIAQTPSTPPPAAPTATTACTEAKKLAAQEAAKKETDRIAARLKVTEAQIDGEIGSAASEAAKKALEAKKLAAQEAAKKETDRIAARLKVTEAQIDASGDCDPAAGSSATPANPCETEKLFCSYVIGLADHFGLDRRELMRLLGSAQKGTSAQAVAKIESPRQARAVNSVFTDDRYTVAAGKTAEALAALNTAVQTAGSEAKSAAVKADEAFNRAETATQTASAAHRRADDLDTRVGRIADTLSAVRDAAAEMREQLQSARVPRRGPLGLLGGTRPLVKK